MTHDQRIFKILRLSGLLALPATAASAASTSTYYGSENFTATPIEMVVDIQIDDTSAGISSLGQFYDFDDSGVDGSLDGSLTIGNAVGSSEVSLVNDITGPLIQVTAESEGNYVPADPDEVQVSSSTSMDFELQYDDGGDGATIEATAVICLMPIRLSLTEGSAVGNPASSSYGYTLEIDGNDVYSSSMLLTMTPTGAVQLSALEGVARTDGVYFQSGNTQGFDFPALTIEKSMGIFDDGELYEGRITFNATTVAPDANWGAFAGAQVGGVDQSEFIPKVGSPIPEPQSTLLLLAGLALALRRRA